MHWKCISRALLAGACLVAAFSAGAQQQYPSEETPYVQSPRGVVEAMLDLAGVRKGDYLIDLGSGDGRIILTAAAKYGASGFGVDIDPRLVRLSNQAAQAAGLAARARFIEQDLFKTELAPATVLTLYLLPEFNMVLRPRLLEQLKPGTRIVSHDADMGDWRPDASLEVAAPDKTVGIRKSSMVYLWTVPARVEGRWLVRLATAKDKRSAEIDLELAQAFQDLSGRANIRSRGQALQLSHAFVQGNVLFWQLGMGADAMLFTGRVTGDRLAGSVTDAKGREIRWQAHRQNAPRVLSAR
jgi:hypothetical protein